MGNQSDIKNKGINYQSSAVLALIVLLSYAFFATQGFGG